jgi:C4-dicarboxylate-specific signal transduction histidine kinase
MNSIAPITSASRSLRALFLDGEEPLEPSLIDEKKITDTLDGLDIIGSMSAGLQYFVENYRKLSRIPDPVTVPLDLPRWTGTLKVLAGEIVEQGGGRLEISLKEGTPQPKADEGLLNQVMLNLVRNAMEAPGREPVRKVEIRIGPSEGGKTSIRVKNNGAPIPPEELDKIFIPFYTTKEEGAGIGLFLSRQIIFMHHGTLDAYTAPDGDPVFEILI